MLDLVDRKAGLPIKRVPGLKQTYEECRFLTFPPLGILGREHPISRSQSLDYPTVFVVLGSLKSA
jgi:hypothetical protein